MIRKIHFLRGVLGSTYIYLGLALDMALQFYSSVAKGLKLKVLGANFYVCRSYREKLVGDVFAPTILNRVNIFNFNFYNEKVTFIDFYVKDVNKAVPYYQ